MESKSLVVFTYGTLKPGEERFYIIEPYLSSTKNAKLYGVQLWDLGAFPGITKGDEVVEGTLLEFPEEHADRILHTLDRIEGYNEIDPDNSLYIRKEVVVETEEGKVKCFTYFLQNKSSKVSVFLSSVRKMEETSWTRR